MTKILPLLLGGILPALLYGIAGVLQKISAKHGGSEALYLVGFGAATVVVGVLYRWKLSATWGTSQSLGFALLAGTAFALGAGLISFALIHFGASIAQLSPLYNMNVVVTVLMGLFLLQETQEVQVSPLIGGTALILAGAWLVSRA